MGAECESERNKKNDKKYLEEKKKIKEENEKNEPNIINKPTSSNNIKQIKEFKCTYNRDELLNKLKDFLSQIEIQRTSFGNKNKLHDSVLELINVEESKELINFFNSCKNEFLNEILKYLTLQKINIDPNNISQIIISENGDQVYKKKIMDVISKFNNDKDYFKINYLTILILGKSGVGKSSLINKILNVNAPTGNGHFVTIKTTPYQSNSMPFIRLVDTRGIEISQNYGAEQVKEEAKRFIKNQLITKDINNFVHCIWYCISGNRFEDEEIKLLSSLQGTYKNNKIPIIIVYTQPTDNDTINQMKDYINKQNIDCTDFIKVLAYDKNICDGQILKSFGTNELLSLTLNKCKKALKGDMHSVMTNQISRDIANNIKNENSNIKDYIYEQSILNFIKGYNFKSDEDFQNIVIDIYGYNINYYLNKNISKETISIIKNSDLINYHNNNFIKYYHEKVNSIISNEIKQLAYKFLDIQATKEQEKGKPTLNQNKRNYNDFIATNKEFLYYNFNYLAQKYYIGKFIEYTSEPLSKTFEAILNKTMINLFKQKEIKILIHKCFLNKYKEFEERIKLSTQNSIKIEDTNDDDFSYISDKSIKSQFSSNFFSNQNIIRKNSLKSNNNEEKRIKEFSELQSVITIPISYLNSKNVNGNNNYY